MGYLISMNADEVSIPWFLRDKRYTPEQEFVAQARARRTGQVLPLTVRDAGEGGLEAIGEPLELHTLRAAGFGEIQCWSLGVLTDAEAIRLGFEAGLYDDVDWSHIAALVRIVFERWTASDIAQTTDLTLEELEHLRDLLDFEWETIGDSKEADLFSVGNEGEFLFEGMEQ